MSSAIFDTLQFVETLQEAGVPENHAKAISKAVRNVYDTVEPVTKTDLREAVSELRAETKTLGAELRFEIQRLDSKIESLDAKLDLKIDSLDAKLDSKIESLDAKLNSKIDGLDAKLDAKEESLNSKIDKLGLQLTIRLGGLVVVALGALMTFSKWAA